MAPDIDPLAGDDLITRSGDFLGNALIKGGDGNGTITATPDLYRAVLSGGRGMMS